LWLLGDGAKFSGWVNTIARRVAINFGLRHRRELNRRELWNDIEAWVCRQRLERILRQRKENPQAPIGSLLQPGEI
jgi:DNA-directed RNA polymerase specialized sigma24 family protein